MDVSMPRLNGIEATRQIASKHPDVQVLGLLMRDDVANRQALAEAGAAGFVDKAAGADELVNAIRTCFEAGGITSDYSAEEL